MGDLSKQTCEACSSGAKPLTKDEIQHYLREVDDWELIEEAGIQKLKRVFLTLNYTKSIDFTIEVARMAERADHHPQLIVDYGTVAVIWWSHKIKGLHKNDFIMAAKTSERF